MLNIKTFFSAAMFNEKLEIWQIVRHFLSLGCHKFERTK